MRWFTRTTALLTLTAGLIAGIVAPAEAHDDVPHIVGFEGSVAIRDYEGWPDSDVKCRRSPNVKLIAQRPSKYTQHLFWQSTCGGEARVTISFVATLRTDGSVRYVGSIKLDEYDFGFGWSTVGEDTDIRFTTTLDEDDDTVTRAWNDGDQASTTTVITFVNTH